MKNKNSGYVMVLDALIALSIVLLVSAVIITEHESTTNRLSATAFKETHYISEDVLDVLNKQGALDSLGTDWAAANGSNPAWSNESNTTFRYLDLLIPKKYGYRLEIDGTTIYDTQNNASSGRPKNNSIISQTHASRLSRLRKRPADKGTGRKSIPVKHRRKNNQHLRLLRRIRRTRQPDKTGDPPGRHRHRPKHMLRI